MANAVGLLHMVFLQILVVFVHLRAPLFRRIPPGKILRVWPAFRIELGQWMRFQVIQNPCAVLPFVKTDADVAALDVLFRGSPAIARLAGWIVTLGLSAPPASRPVTFRGKSDKTASSPVEDPVHPMEMLATIYHAFGIDPATGVYDHLNQPRELVKAAAVTKLIA